MENPQKFRTIHWDGKKTKKEGGFGREHVCESLGNAAALEDLQELKITKVEKGGFKAYMKSQGKLGGQNKNWKKKDWNS